jgi:Family of unknown function (DUF6507)
MSGWDIDPDGVHRVLSRTQHVAEQFEGELTSISSALQSGAENSSSGIVAAAVEGFATAVQGDIRFALERTGAVLTAATASTTAYLQGDLEMAASTQAAATVVGPR